jgi:hypothetical protein
MLLKHTLTDEHRADHDRLEMPAISTHPNLAVREPQQDQPLNVFRLHDKPL